MRVVWLTMSMMVFVACGSSRMQKSQSFMESVRAYNEGVRWQRWTHAASHIAPRERDDFLEERDELEEDLRITNYEIKNVRLGPEAKRARVHVKYEWHSDREGIVKSTTSRQMWERQGRRWIVAEEYRIRGDEMPGLAEEPDPADSEVDDALRDEDTEDSAAGEPAPKPGKRRSARR